MTAQVEEIETSLLRCEGNEFSLRHCPQRIRPYQLDRSALNKTDDADVTALVRSSLAEGFEELNDDTIHDTVPEYRFKNFLDDMVPKRCFLRLTSLSMTTPIVHEIGNTHLIPEQNDKIGRENRKSLKLLATVVFDREKGQWVRMCPTMDNSVTEQECCSTDKLFSSTCSDKGSVLSHTIVVTKGVAMSSPNSKVTHGDAEIENINFCNGKFDVKSVVTSQTLGSRNDLKPACRGPAQNEFNTVEGSSCISSELPECQRLSGRRGLEFRMFLLSPVVIVECRPCITAEEHREKNGINQSIGLSLGKRKAEASVHGTCSLEMKKSKLDEENLVRDTITELDRTKETDSIFLRQQNRVDYFPRRFSTTFTVLHKEVPNNMCSLNNNSDSERRAEVESCNKNLSSTCLVETTKPDITTEINRSQSCKMEPKRPTKTLKGIKSYLKTKSSLGNIGLKSKMIKCLQNRVDKSGSKLEQNSEKQRKKSKRSMRPRQNIDYMGTKIDRFGEAINMEVTKSARTFVIDSHGENGELNTVKEDENVALSKTPSVTVLDNVIMNNKKPSEYLDMDKNCVAYTDKNNAKEEGKHMGAKLNFVKRTKSRDAPVNDFHQNRKTIYHKKHVASNKSLYKNIKTKAEKLDNADEVIKEEGHKENATSDKLQKNIIIRAKDKDFVTNKLEGVPVGDDGQSRKEVDHEVDRNVLLRLRARSPVCYNTWKKICEESVTHTAVSEIADSVNNVLEDVFVDDRDQISKEDNGEISRNVLCRLRARSPVCYNTSTKICKDSETLETHLENGMTDSTMTVPGLMRNTQNYNEKVDSKTGTRRRIGDTVEQNTSDDPPENKTMGEKANIVERSKSKDVFLENFKEINSSVLFRLRARSPVCYNPSIKIHKDKLSCKSENESSVKDAIHHSIGDTTADSGVKTETKYFKESSGQEVIHDSDDWHVTEVVEAAEHEKDLVAAESCNLEDSKSAILKQVKGLENDLKKGKVEINSDKFACKRKLRTQEHVDYFPSRMKRKHSESETITVTADKRHRYSDSEKGTEGHGIGIDTAEGCRSDAYFEQEVTASVSNPGKKDGSPLSSYMEMDENSNQIEIEPVSQTTSNELNNLTVEKKVETNTVKANLTKQMSRKAKQDTDTFSVSDCEDGRKGSLRERIIVNYFPHRKLQNSFKPVHETPDGVQHIPDTSLNISDRVTATNGAKVNKDGNKTEHPLIDGNVKIDENQFPESNTSSEQLLACKILITGMVNESSHNCRSDNDSNSPPLTSFDQKDKFVKDCGIEDSVDKQHANINLQRQDETCYLDEIEDYEFMEPNVAMKDFKSVVDYEDRTLEQPSQQELFEKEDLENGENCHFSEGMSKTSTKYVDPDAITTIESTEICGNPTEDMNTIESIGEKVCDDGDLAKAPSNINTTDQEPLYQGSVVWGKFSKIRWWPGIVIDGRMVKRTTKPGCVWLFWLSDKQVSQVKEYYVEPFGCDFVTRTTKNVNTKMKNGIVRALEICAERAGVDMTQYNSVEDWAAADDGFLKMAENGKKQFAPPSDSPIPDNVLEDLGIIEKKHRTAAELSLVDCGMMNSRSSLDNKGETGSEMTERSPMFGEGGRCISCDLNPEVSYNHPLFEGSLCRKCKEGLKSSFYAIDDDGCSMFCAICGEGGQLFVCESQQCGKAYCFQCVERHTSPVTFKLIKETNSWNCFICTLFTEPTHGTLIPRPDWSLEVIKFFQTGTIPLCNDLNYLSSGCKRKMRVLSLFDGISTGKVALDELGLDVEVYYASEVSQDAMLVSQYHHQVPQVGDAWDLDREKLERLCPIDLVLGGPPCNDLSIVNPLRKGFNGTGVLLFKYVTIVKDIELICKGTNHVFWLLENTGSMITEFKQTISKLLGMEPAVWDAKYFTGQRRARNFWGNIPGLYTTPEFCRQLEQEKKDLDHALIANCNRKALIPEMRTVTTKANSLTVHNGRESLPVVMNGKEDGIWITELDRLFGFPTHYTDIGNLTHDRRRKLIGMAWSVPVIKHLLAPLTQYFKLRDSRT